MKTIAAISATTVLALAVFLSLAIFAQGIYTPIAVFHIRHHAPGCIAFAGGHYIGAWYENSRDGECRLFGIKVPT